MRSASSAIGAACERGNRQRQQQWSPNGADNPIGSGVSRLIFQLLEMILNGACIFQLLQVRYQLGWGTMAPWVERQWVRFA